MDKNNLRIIFMGTPKIASGVLETLIENGYNIVAAVTKIDQKVGRKQILTYSPVKEMALKHDIPVIQPLKMKDELDTILSYEPDLVITIAFGQFIPSKLLDYPKYHCINIHGSILPKYRGGAPIQRAIINGDQSTGMTLMYMNPKMDEGDILVSESIDIDIKDTSSTLFDKLEELSKSMIIRYLPDIIDGKIAPIPQDESKATYAYNLSKEDEYIDFNQDVLSVYNRMRGLLEEPAPYSIICGKKIKFHEVEYSDQVLADPATFIGMHDNKIAIAAKNGTILVSKIQMEGKSIVGAKDFYNGQGRNLVGKCFEEKDEQAG